MKVAFLAGRLSDRASGVTVAVEQLSAALGSRGVEVDVFGLSDDPADTGEGQAWAGAPATLCRTLGPRAFGYAPSLLGQVLRRDVELVHLHGIWMHSAIVARQWAARTGRPLLISPHGMLSGVALSISPLRKRVARVLFQDGCFRVAAGVHATSETEADDIRAFGLHQPIFRFPNGIAEPLVEPLPAEHRQNRVVFLGRLHRVKGLDRLLKAWASIEPERPEWRLEIVGPGEEGYVSQLRHLVARLGLSRVTIGGGVHGEDKYVLLGSSKLFVLPTLSENFAMTVAESLVCETPVICTRGAPWRGLEEHGCGWWIDHGEEPLAGALNRAMELSDQERARMGRAGRAWMRRDFTWPAAAEKAERAYASLLDGAERKRPLTGASVD